MSCLALPIRHVWAGELIRRFQPAVSQSRDTATFLGFVWPGGLELGHNSYRLIRKFKFYIKDAFKLLDSQGEIPRSIIILVLGLIGLI